MIRYVTDTVAVAPQITLEHIPQLAAEGYDAVICNRPDGEEPGQLDAAAVEAAAKAAGLSFAHIPLGRDGITQDHLDATAQAFNAHQKVLAYCRSGTRSITLWVLAQARDGADPHELLRLADQAGYDLSHLHGTLHEMAGH
ncbi:TIGR01244 family sulfur transferase [Parvularcula sp. LCG005]|uniref:TIGR01244 family sulfur transferase n=1 Tax=Parvularcula sp. LCG005 TaxID=3078805 RepID=UPI002941FD49|nr:TIGR01244 family sulfur transferase [Parvularcula sp. LCG005]WOI53604.1 TIGR01244 family sulfur transferase [Parvularcula sp. LCG005]